MSKKNKNQNTATPNGGQVIEGRKAYVYSTDSMKKYIQRVTLQRIPNALGIIEVVNFQESPLKPIMLCMMNVEVERIDNIFYNNGTTDTIEDNIKLKNYDSFRKLMFDEDTIERIKEVGETKMLLKKSEIAMIVSMSKPSYLKNGAIGLYLNPIRVLTNMWLEDNPGESADSISLRITKMKKSKHGGGVNYTFEVSRIGNTDNNNAKTEMRLLKEAAEDARRLGAGYYDCNGHFNKF